MTHGLLSPLGDYVLSYFLTYGQRHTTIASQSRDKGSTKINVAQNVRGRRQARRNVATKDAVPLS